MLEKKIQEMSCEEAKEDLQKALGCLGILSTLILHGFMMVSQRGILESQEDGNLDEKVEHLNMAMKGASLLIQKYYPDMHEKMDAIAIHSLFDIVNSMEEQKQQEELRKHSEKN